MRFPRATRRASSPVGPHRQDHHRRQHCRLIRPRPVASSSPAAAPQQRTVGRPHDRRQRRPRHRGLALLKQRAGGQPYQRILGGVGVDRRGDADRNRRSRFDQARSATSGDPAYSRAMGRFSCLRKSSLRASPSRDWTVRSCMTPSRRSWRWTAGEKWPAMVTVPGPRFREGRGGGAVSPSGRESTLAKGFVQRQLEIPGNDN